MILSIVFFLVSIFPLVNSQTDVISQKKRREIVSLVPNSLNQARFYQLRRKPFKITPINSETQVLKESPILLCSQNSIGILLKQKFTGRIFASHKEDVKECVEYIGWETAARFQTSTKGICGVRKMIMGFPTKSVQYHLRVVVSFGAEHLTEEDQIFDLTCSFSMLNSTVDAFYDTVNYSPKLLMNAKQLPDCHYSLHKNAIDGHLLGSAKVGEVVFHKWQCPTQEYAFKVYRCYVHNGVKQSYMIVDDKGCSMDEEIIPHPSYDMDKGLVYTPAKAFRFAKSKRVHFNCLLAVCHKSDQSCMQDIPPRCPRTQKKRQLPENLTVEERLYRIHALLHGQNYSDGRIMSLATQHLTVEQDVEDETQVQQVCTVTSQQFWIYFLCGTNIVAILIAAISCCRLYKNKYSFDVQTWRNTVVRKMTF